MASFVPPSDASSDTDHAAQPSAATVEVTIGISVHVDRIGQIDLQPMRDGARYLIMVQGGAAPPVASLHRPDVTIAHIGEPGISQSRSAVIDRCGTPVLLFMDDDVALDLDGVQALAAYLMSRPELSVVAGIIERDDRRPGKAQPVPMTRWNTGRAMTPETMIRVADVRDSGVRFDREFGLKGTYPLGDEYVFITDLLKAGRQGARVPIYLGSHWGPSTGDNWKDPKLLAARRAVLRRVFGSYAPLVRVGFAIKHRRRLGGWPAAMRFALGR